MPPTTPDRPNVLLICTDHWSGLITRQAGHPVVMTPTLDQFSRNGVTFTNAYSATPSCIPARRTLMTGMSNRSLGGRDLTSRDRLPDVPTMAQCFRDGGYQAYAVGKLHVYPQRNRIGFDDAIIDEQGRQHLGGGADDYELFLVDQGYPGLAYGTGMVHNDMITRPWHLPEYCHPVNWAVREMSRTIRRRDPQKPGFWYLSFSPLSASMTPLQAYLDLYRDIEIDRPSTGNWSSDPDRLPYALKAKNVNKSSLVDAPWHDQELARRGFYAIATQIDHQIRLMVGMLREEDLLDNTVIVFTGDHGHMLGDHGLWCMTPFYEMAAKIPLIIVPPAADTRFQRGAVDGRLAEFGDIMPTLLDLCTLPIPDTVEGISLWSDRRRDVLFGEMAKGKQAMRTIRAGRYKLIYYPTGNHVQLFDTEDDPRETTDLSGDSRYAEERERLKDLLIQHLYGGDEEWVQDGELVGLPEVKFVSPDARDLGNQRGLRFL